MDKRNPAIQAVFAPGSAGVIEAAAVAGYKAMTPIYDFPTGFNEAPEGIRMAYRMIARAVLSTSFPETLVAASGVSYAATGVYMTLLNFPWGIDDPDELVGRGLTRETVEAALQELLDNGLIERRRL